MKEFTVTCTMSRRDHFKAQLDILYRAAVHALILFGVVFAAFWIVFFIDLSKNGAYLSWGITSSLMYFAIVVTVMVAVYFAYAPLHALIKSAMIARNSVNVSPYDVTFGKDKISVRYSDFSARYLGWLDLKIHRRTKRFLIVRDRKKKYDSGQLILPLADVSEEQVKMILRYREDVMRADAIKNNPVAAERARQQELTARKREQRAALERQAQEVSEKTESDEIETAEEPQEEIQGKGE